MSFILLLISDDLVALPNAESIVLSKKNEILSKTSQDSVIDQFLISNVVLNKVDLTPNYYDSIYYLDSEDFNLEIPNHSAIKDSLRNSTVSLTKKPTSSSKVGSKLSSLKFKRLQNKRKSSNPVLPELSVNAADKKLIYFGESSDEDELINEDELIQNQKLETNSIICIREQFQSGVKRRKACKDCTCGLAEKEAFGFEPQPKIQFSAKELSEIDFTIEGKTGGCGSCSLGDAFRCSGCPYLGLPAFKPGQAITLDSIDDDL